MHEHMKIIEEDIMNLYSEAQAELESLSTNEEKLFELEERINVIQNLKRKYGNTIEKILEYHEELKNKREEILYLQREKDLLIFLRVHSYLKNF